MQAEITANGELKVIAENALEAYALKQWHLHWKCHGEKCHFVSSTFHGYINFAVDEKTFAKLSKESR